MTGAVGRLLIAVAVLGGLGGLPAAEPGEKTATQGGKATLEAAGYVVPVSLIRVPTRVSGQVAAVAPALAEGTLVKKGDVLARLDDTEYRAERDRAQAIVERAAARYKQLKDGPRKEEVAQAAAEVDEAEEAFKKGLVSAARVRRLRLAHQLVKQGPRAEVVEAAQADLKI